MVRGLPNDFFFPSIAHIVWRKTGEQLFTIIYEIKNDTVVYKHPFRNLLLKEKLEEFEQTFTGNLLLLDSSNAIAEKEYFSRKTKETFRKIINACSLLLLPTLALSSIIIYNFNTSSLNVFPILFLLISLLGTTASFILVFYDIDSHNPITKKICQSIGKLNCSAVLNSPMSKLMGLSWSIIGLSYFIGINLSLITVGLANIQVLTILSFVNLISLPYIIFSIFYQWKIVKTWCLLCLIVQSTLGLLFIVSLQGGFFEISQLNNLSFSILANILIFFCLSFIGLSITVPALKKAREGREYFNKIQRIKLDSSIFKALLIKQRRINYSTDGLGIVIGNPLAQNRIIKICNPFCIPCCEAHSFLEELINYNSDVSLQIIFTSTGEDSDPQTFPIRHLLAVAENGDEYRIKEVLHSWYSEKKKNYERFAKRFPIKESLITQNKKIEAMKRWCDAEQISVTPTFFVNGFQLPDVYSVEDLKYILRGESEL